MVIKLKIYVFLYVIISINFVFYIEEFFNVSNFWFVKYGRFFVCWDINCCNIVVRYIINKLYLIEVSGDYGVIFL